MAKGQQKSNRDTKKPKADKNKPKPSLTLTIQPGFFYFFTATVIDGLKSGFQIRAERQSGLGVANLLLSKSDWPNHPNDIRAFQSVNVGMLGCSVCSAIMPPGKPSTLNPKP